ncbi:hypothetical protein ACQ4PT_060204 [Festuca glaucescens]
MSAENRVVLSGSDLSSPEPSRPRSGGVGEGGVDGGGGARGVQERAVAWQVAEGSRHRRRMLRRLEQGRHHQQPRRQRRSPQLPAAHPPPHRFIPAELHGLCYNCALPGHISRECTNEVHCIACGEAEHMSRGCKRPRSPSAPSRSPSPGVQPERAPVDSRSAERHDLPPPPPPGTVRFVRPWTAVVREGSVESSARGPSFSVPFAQSRAHAGACPRLVPPVATPPVKPCFLEFSEEMHHMEEQLRRAVVVTITGARPEVDLADAAALLHAEFGIGPSDMSIRAFSPEDFLVLCGDRRVRDRMVAKSLVHASWFSLSLRGWLRQAHATAVDLPFLVPLELRGVPGHA